MSLFANILCVLIGFVRVCCTNEHRCILLCVRNVTPVSREHSGVRRCSSVRESRTMRTSRNIFIETYFQYNDFSREIYFENITTHSVFTNLFVLCYENMNRCEYELVRFISPFLIFHAYSANAIWSHQMFIWNQSNRSHDIRIAIAVKLDKCECFE